MTTVDEVQCRHCLDSGTIEIYDHEDDFLTWMRCSCERGEMIHWVRVPQWNRDAAAIYRRKPIAASWFKPQFDDENLAEEKTWEKVNEWMAKLKLAEAYWDFERKRHA